MLLLKYQKVYSNNLFCSKFFSFLNIKQENKLLENLTKVRKKTAATGRLQIETRCWTETGKQMFIDALCQLCREELAKLSMSKYIKEG